MHISRVDQSNSEESLRKEIHISQAKEMSGSGRLCRSHAVRFSLAKHNSAWDSWGSVHQLICEFNLNWHSNPIDYAAQNAVELQAQSMLPIEPTGIRWWKHSYVCAWVCLCAETCLCIEWKSGGKYVKIWMRDSSHRKQIKNGARCIQYAGLNHILFCLSPFWEDKLITPFQESCWVIDSLI